MEHEEHEDLKSSAPRPQGPQGPGGGGPGGEMAKDLKGIVKKLKQYMKKYQLILMIAICFAMLGSIFTLMGPSYISDLTDEIISGISSDMMVSELEKNGMDIDMLIEMNPSMEEFSQMMDMEIAELEEMGLTVDSVINHGIDMDIIWNIGSTLAGIYALSYVLSIIQGLIISTVMQNTAKTLRTDIANKINHLPMNYFSQNSKGDVLSRVTNDVDMIGQSLTQSMGTFISAVTLLVGSVIMMFFTNIPLTITAILSTAIGFIFMMVIMKTSQKHFKNQQKYLGKINGHIEEMYAGHQVVKAYNGEEKAIEVFQDINTNLRKSAFTAQAMSGLMMPMMTFIGNFGYVCVCIVGAMLALEGIISFSIIVAFMIYIRLFTQPLAQIAQSMQNLQSGMAAAERAFEFLQEEELPDESHKTKTLAHIKGDVEFRNVHFGYDDTKTIINDFSVTTKQGQKVAIVGPTGAGKTTLINLLMRFYDVNSGDILIDGVSIKDVKREEVHSKFCMVLQDTWLFEGSLKENLVYSTPNITDQQIEDACKAVGLHHFIKTLSQGYNTILNDSVNLSQGQKQQITIARAMIADKPMLILDEATSSVDTRTELQIQSAMDSLMKGRTSFVIAHRLSTIKNADLILVMKDGDIIEKGNHEALLKENGFYAELYNAQFSEPVA